MHAIRAILILSVLTTSTVLHAQTLPWEKNDLELNATLAPYTWFASTQFAEDGTPFDLLTEGSTGAVNAFGSAIEIDFVPVDRLIIFFQTDVKSITLVAPDSKATTSGFGDFRFGGTYLAYDGAVAFVVGGAVTAPTGYSPDLGPFRPTLGDGVYAFEAVLQLGQSFDNPFFFVFETGYKLRGVRTPRGGGPNLKFADLIPVKLDLGFELSESFRFLMLGEITFAFTDRTTIERVTFSDPGSTDARVGFGGRFLVSETFEVGGYLKFTMAGRNALNRTEIGALVSTSLDLSL